MRLGQALSQGSDQQGPRRLRAARSGARTGSPGQGFAPYELVRELYDNSPPSASAGVLCTFLAGENAERAGRLSAADRRARRARGHGRSTSGPRALEPVDFIETDWSAQEWTRGAYGTSFGVGGLTRFGEDLRRPVGPIHWACTDIAGVGHIHMEGAIRSGRRAAEAAMTAAAA